jgi:nucleoside-diphosphate-sugar epimerase
VTGAAGFIGANLVRRLLDAGHDPIVVCRPGEEPWRLAEVLGQLEVTEADLEDVDRTTDIAVSAKPDVIFHLAAHGAYSWQQDLSRMLAVNVRATEALLQAAVATGAALVNAGSSSEYGYQEAPPSEHGGVRPNSHYAVTKVAATHLCQLAADRFGIRTATLRLYSVYGPWEDPRRLLPTLISHCQAGGWPPLVDPRTARDFVWIDDVCDAFLRAATTEVTEPGAVFNIASGTQTTLGQLVAAAAEVFGVSDEPVWGTMEQRSWDTSTWVGDPQRAALELGWRMTTPLEAGLRKLGDWLEHEPGLGDRYSVADQAPTNP